MQGKGIKGLAIKQLKNEIPHWRRLTKKARTPSIRGNDIELPLW